MVQGYDVKNKKKVEIQNPKAVKMKKTILSSQKIISGFNTMSHHGDCVLRIELGKIF